MLTVIRQNSSTRQVHDLVVRHSRSCPDLHVDYHVYFKNLISCSLVSTLFPVFILRYSEWLYFRCESKTSSKLHHQGTNFLPRDISARIQAVVKQLQNACVLQLKRIFLINDGGCILLTWPIWGQSKPRRLHY